MTRRKFDFDVDEFVAPKQKAGSGEENTTEINPSDTVQWIDVSKLIEDPDNDAIYQIKGLEGLAESLKKDGMTNPIRAYKLPDSDKYMIQGGHRRRKAAIIANIEKVPVLVQEWIDDPEERKRKLVADNLNNREKNPLEIARELTVYASTIHNASRTEVIDELANVTGRSTSSVRRYMSLLNLIPKLQEKSVDERYSYVALSDAAVLSEEQQNKLNNLLEDYLESHGEGTTLSKDLIYGLIKAVKEDSTEKQSTVPKQLTVRQLKRVTMRYSKNFSSVLNELKLEDFSEDERNKAIECVKEFKNSIDEWLVSQNNNI